MAPSKARLVDSEPVEGPWELPLGWGWRRLGDAVEVHDYLRRPLNQSERNARLHSNPDGELYPYYGATGQVGEIDGYLAEGEYALLGEDGAPFLDKYRNKAYFVSGRVWVNNHAHVLRAADLFGNKWLLHWLNTIDYRGFVNGTTRLKLTQGAMNEMPVPIPPAGLEERIIGRIDELFTEIDNGEAALEQARTDLATWRKALLKAAVTGELTADWRAANPPSETGADFLARILAERHTRWTADPRNKGKHYVGRPDHNEAELPDLPEGWVWTDVGTLLEEGIQNGLYLPQTAYGQGVPIMRIDDFQAAHARPSASLRRVSVSQEIEQTYSLVAGDYVINRVNSPTHLAKSFLVREEHLPALFESNMMRMRPTRLVNGDFLELYLASDIGRARLCRNAKSAVNQASVNQSDVGLTPVPLPPRPEQTMIVDTLRRLLTPQAKAEVEELSAVSATLRQSVLAAAFRGDLVA